MPLHKFDVKMVQMYKFAGFLRIVAKIVDFRLIWLGCASGTALPEGIKSDGKYGARLG
jgi:hypothetical protein